MNPVSVVLNSVSVYLRGREGPSRTLVNDISAVVPGGNLFAILGGSGSGTYPISFVVQGC